jgi:excisionase family DNA binding protein
MHTTQHSPTWLRLGEAADYLGVHPATLRRWADEGRVTCSRTPGGRRRFVQTDLDLFLASMRSEAEPGREASIALLASSPMESVSPQMSIRDQSWYGHLNPDHRATLRGQGQKLMATLMHYVSRDEGEAYLREGERLAEGYAELFHKHGLSLVDVITSFLMVRRSITSSLHESRHDRGPMDEATWRLYHRTEDFLDHILMTMIGVYQDAER